VPVHGKIRGNTERACPYKKSGNHTAEPLDENERIDAASFSPPKLALGRSLGKYPINLVWKEIDEALDLRHGQNWCVGLMLRDR